MKTQTFIKGKDSDLESSIETMQTKLKDLDLEITQASWLAPIPYVYSVHIHNSAYPAMFTNGKGSSEKSCLASALGEYFERLSCNYFFADYYLGEGFANASFVHYPDEQWFKGDTKEMRHELLTSTLWKFYDPEKELTVKQFIDTNAGANDRGICALPFIDLKTQERVLFPVNIIGNLYVSNGMAAGNTLAEARVQALSEIFERYVKNKIISEGLCLPEIPSEVIAKFPTIEASLERLKESGFELRIADASLGGVYPVVSVTLIDPKEGTVFASFGAHPCFEVAFERTVTELLQGRALTQVDDFQAPSFNLEEVADYTNLETHFINSSGLLSFEFFKHTPDYAFTPWDHDTTTQSEFEYLTQKIYAMGFSVYCADYYHLDVHACRIIVPGMSEIYPVDDLVWSNNNEGVFFRESILSLNTLSKGQMQTLLDELFESSANELQKVAEFIGVIADQNTPWTQFHLGELKALLALAVGEFDHAQEGIIWALHSIELSAEKRLYYRCIHALLELKLDRTKKLVEYEAGFEKLYTKTMLQICQEHLKGQNIFKHLHTPGLSLEGFVTHTKLLDVYKKLHTAKERYWKSL